MKKNQKYLIGGITLAALVFLAIKAFGRKKTPTEPEKPKKRGTIILDEPTGGFMLPAEVITKMNSRLREKPSTSSKIVHTYVTPTRLLVDGDSMESDGQWFQVRDDKGRTGWIRNDVVNYELTTSGTKPSIEDWTIDDWTDYYGDYYGAPK